MFFRNKSPFLTSHLFFSFCVLIYSIRTFGDKLCAATGLGWDDPELGWHHCPPGMGIYDYVRVEVRNRINITDLFVRPILEDKKAVVWITVENADYIEKPINISLSVYGQNFRQKVVKDYVFDPYYTAFQGGR